MGEFRMPSLGADMDEGTLVEWRVAVGDQVNRGDIVAVVDTSKSAIDIEVFEDGVFKAITPEAAVKARLTPQSTGPAPVAAALAETKTWIAVRRAR